ncbi:MAG: thioredoxin family protein [Deltaproteobacteria bacterium]|nr:thioredoxin family protein [Deltaproteobacteria bacterium]
MIHEITDQNFKEQVLNSPRTFLLEFTSPWCAACKKISVLLDTFSKNVQDILIGKIDISTSPKTAAELQVLSVPVVIIFKAGKEIKRLSGQISEKNLAHEVENLK